jgi:hypothetical protein
MAEDYSIISGCSKNIQIFEAWNSVFVPYNKHKTSLLIMFRKIITDYREIS